MAFIGYGRCKNPIAMLVRSHFLPLFKTACYAGGGFLAGAVFGAIAAASMPHGVWPTFMIVMSASLCSSAGSMIGARRPLRHARA